MDGAIGDVEEARGQYNGSSFDRRENTAENLKRYLGSEYISERTGYGSVKFKYIEGHDL
jgi:recombination DNA repair RAD52 pathway protein